MTTNPCFINIQEAKNNFSKLLVRAHAGEEIIICKAGKPYARLVALETRSQRELGFLRDRFSDDDIDAIETALQTPLPEDELHLWYKAVNTPTGYLADRKVDPNKDASS